MSTTLKNVKIPYPTEGVIRSAQLDDTVTPENSVQMALNLNFDRIGAQTTRLGVETYATALSGSILSFGKLNIQATGVNRLFAQVGNKIYAWNGTVWSASLVTLTSATNRVRYSQYLNYTWIASGNDGAGGSAIQISNGGAFTTVGVPANFPKGDFIQAGFEGRVWVADKATDTIYYTDIVQFTPPSTYALTYDSTVNFIKNLSPQDGQSITGLIRVPRALLVFKEDQIFRIYGATSVDSYPAYNVGTRSQESIVTTKDGIYFHHSSGFYKFAYDSQPVEISRRVIDFVKAIPAANYENVVGVYNGFDAVEWAVGPVTVEGVTYSNCVMRYTISTQVWTIYDYGTNIIKSMITYVDSTRINQLIGTTTGKIGKLDSGYTDFWTTLPSDGLSIPFESIDRWRSFTEMYSHDKNVSGIMVASENAAGSLLQYQTDKAGPNVWTDIDTLDENECSLFPNVSTDDFNVIRLRIRGNTKGEPVIIHGTELLTIQDKGLRQN